MVLRHLGELANTSALVVADGARSLGTTASATLGDLVEAVRTAFLGDPQTRRQVAFSIAMIALSAKMAKADGVVTTDEVAAFERLFAIPEGERRNVARVYDIAKGDVAGFEGYATQLAGLCDDGTASCALLEDILDGLFHIAKADGVLHENELAFLTRIAEIFELDEPAFARIVARHVADAAADGEGGDPYAVLGVSRDAGAEAVRARYKELVREAHPDRAIARGLPDEFVAIATERLAAYNRAMDRIRAGGGA